MPRAVFPGSAARHAAVGRCHGPQQGQVPARALLRVLLVALWSGAAAAVAAQDVEQPAQVTQEQGGFRDASFDLTFRKYIPPANAYSPYYSWDATLALDATVFRKGSNALDFVGVVQTVGTESVVREASVGGTGYVIRLEFVHTCSRDVTVSAGVNHLSTHLARDLDRKVAEQQRNGVPIPTVGDATEYNVFFARGRVKLPRYVFAPELEAMIQSANFQWDGTAGGYVRPVYLRSRWTLWRDHRRSVVLETQHEIGNNSFSYFAVSLELFPKEQSDGRLQIFVGGSPGRRFHVSPNVGGLRDGLAVGVRLRFRA